MSRLAEQNLIGCLLIDSGSIEQVYKMLKPDMFTDEVYGAIYREYLNGFDKGHAVNEVTLAEKIGQKFNPVIFSQEISECLEVTATSAEIRSYADVIAKTYKAKKLNDTLQKIVPTSETVDEQIDSLIDELESMQADKTSAKAKSLADITKEYKDSYFVDDGEERIDLGFPLLDDLLGGLEGGDMIVIAARPAVGKSAFVTQITTNLAKKGKKVGFYNLEMQEKQVYERFVAAQSGIGLTRIRRAVKYLNDEEKRFRTANETLEKQDKIIISTGSKTVADIRAESRHMDFDLIIIDYLQLLRPDVSYKGNRYAEVGQISHAIKNLAMELNIPIIALSQLNRVSEAKETKEPSMSEIRESGDVEQDASVIILLWNTSEDNPKEKGCKIEKQRQGRTGKVKMLFNGDLMQFTEIDESRGYTQSVDDMEDIPF